MRPLASTTPAAALVPPTSTPIVRLTTGILPSGGGCLHGRLEGRVGLLDHGGQRVAGPGQGRAQPGGARALALPHPARGPADRTPGTLGRLVLGPVGGGVPHVGRGLVLAQGPADRAGHFLAHAAGAGAHQPALEVAQRVLSRFSHGGASLFVRAYCRAYLYQCRT